MKTDIILAIIPGIFGYNLLIISSLMMIYIIEYMDSSEESIDNILVYIIVYSITLQVYSFSFNYSYPKLFMIIAKLKGFLSQILFEKTLKALCRELSQENQAGKLASLISSDLEFLDGLSIMPYVLSTPFFLVGSIILLWFNLGIAGIIGLLVVSLHFPIIMVLGKLTGKYRFAISCYWRL